MSIATSIGLALSPILALQSVTLVDGPKPDANGLAAEYGSGVCRVSVFGKDAEGEQIKTGVRVGEAVETVGQAGKPKTI